MKELISVVVPVYNEAAGVRRFLDEGLLPVLMGLDVDAEVIVVDDGSRDKTLVEVRGSRAYDKLPVRVVALSRNFGKEAALSAGLKESQGVAVIMIDADGQHPAEAIPQMIEKWREGCMVVTAVRGQNTTKHRLGSRLYYRMMRMMGNRDIVVGAMDFRLMDRAVVDDFNEFAEHNRLVRGLVDWLGYDQAYIKVQTRGRMDGKATYSAKKLMALAGDSLVSMSRTPLMVFGYIGIFIMVVSAIFGLFMLMEQYMMGDPLKLDWSGAVGMSAFVSFLVGLVLVSQAITAMYISQIHAEAKGRPLYVIDRRKSDKPAKVNGIKGSGAKK